MALLKSSIAMWLLWKIQFQFWKKFRISTFEIFLNTLSNKYDHNTNCTCTECIVRVCSYCAEREKNLSQAQLGLKSIVFIYYATYYVTTFFSYFFPSHPLFFTTIMWFLKEVSVCEVVFLERIFIIIFVCLVL